MGLAGFEPATSQSEAGYPIQTRLQALYHILVFHKDDSKKFSLIIFLYSISKKPFHNQLNDFKKGTFLKKREFKE